MAIHAGAATRVDFNGRCLTLIATSAIIHFNSEDQLLHIAFQTVEHGVVLLVAPMDSACRTKNHQYVPGPARLAPLSNPASRGAVRAGEPLTQALAWDTEQANVSGIGLLQYYKQLVEEGVGIARANRRSIGRSVDMAP